MTVRELAARVELGHVAPQRRTPETSDPGRRTEFAEQLRRANESAPGGLKLSAHARQRIEQRGIAMGPAEQWSLHEALLQLATKGSRDALLLRSDAAFIVNVPSRTVVTALETSELRERVFTQIDSAVLLEDAPPTK